MWRFAPGVKFGKTVKVEKEGVGGGEFEVGGQGFGDFEQVVQGAGFGFGVAREDEQLWASGEGTGDRETGLQMEGDGATVEGENGDVVVGFLGRGDGTGKAALFRLVTEKGFEREGREVKCQVRSAKCRGGSVATR